MISLRQLTANPCEAWPYTQPVVFNADQDLHWGHLCSRICAWEQAFASVPNDIVAWYERDSLEFFAGLVALWRLRKRALIPANNLPDTIRQLSGLTDSFAGDFPFDQCVVAPLEAVGSLAPQPLLSASQPALILFTSGSSGAPVAISKTFAQLEAELSALESQWGDALADARITASVSHHHIYGLLFRLLWPVCCGRAFGRFEWDYWETLLPLVATGQRLAIVSSPAHLQRIPQLDLTESLNIAVIFSSGAPLARADSLAANDVFYCVVTEVYGSTETGGIGWRQQAKVEREREQAARWQCLPGVSVQIDAEESLLQVRSPHLPDNNWFTSADKAALEADGRFTLCGRADRIAKVGGKRVSLSAIERMLEQQPGVVQARVIPLPERGGRLGAVLVLDHQGNRTLVDQGKLALNETFKQAIQSSCERVAIPRYWRYLAELPRNRQGKTTLLDLQALFDDAPAPRLPELLGRTANGELQTLQLFIPASLYYFDGHFPGRAVLPGVVLTHWAVHYAREQWGDLGEFSGFEALKFQQVVLPNQTIDLQLEYAPAKNKLYFTYTSGAVETLVAHASGRILFTVGAV